ncbi:hypothetical protein MMC14_006859 [Varicellaria rhodocarpa]|nr:hypothetical protein [Varicellaria rhodocarpa]
MIHTTLVAEQSAALQSLVNGAMKEAQDGRAEWEDVAVESFIHFAEYVYTGDYTLIYAINEAETSQGISAEDQMIPTPAEEPASAQIRYSQRDFDGDLVWEPAILANRIIEVDERPFEDYTNGFGMKKDRKSKKGMPLRPGYRSRFHDLVYPLPLVSLHSSQTPEPLPNVSPIEDYAPVFLGHARVYVFAEKWVIEPLKAIALNKLHEALRNYTRYEARCSDIIELVKYTYDNTPCLNQRDPLRELVIQ